MSVGKRSGSLLTFGEFQIDVVEGLLRRGAVEVPLRAKSFALLRYLAENPGRVLGRAELLEAVWPGAAVSPGVVRVTIQEIRKALGEEGAADGFIETVGRKGYRFAAPDAAPLAGPSFVGRAAELAHLHGLLERCRAMRRQVVFVSGEPGIGKTTLVDCFSEELRSLRLARLASGQCIDLRGASEPYLPVLELLGGLCQEDNDGKVRSALERWAPSWVLQMPGIVDAEAAESLRRRVPNPTRERMLRELTDALDVLAKDNALVLVLEDLHWSDASTLDLLTYLAERSTPARLLVIGTYRPVEAVVRNHTVRARVRDLVSRGRAEDLALELLTQADTETYLTRLFAGTPIDPRLAAFMHRRTDGNPLFLRASVDYLLDRGLLAVKDGVWQLGAAEDAVPPSLRELVMRELDDLADDEQRLLAAASVAGGEFDTICAAAGSGLPAEGAEQSCARLSSRGQLLKATGTSQWPDGARGGTYKFLHALHRDVVYGRLAPAERARLHRAVGERIERGWAADPTPVTGPLAAHFESGQDWTKAVQYHAAAADAAKRRVADHEVAMHCEAVLELLPHLPPSEERDRLEMVYSLELAISRIVARGYGPAELRPLVVRSRDLSVKLGLIQVEAMARFSLLLFELLGGNQHQALVMSQELVDLAERFPVPAFVVMGQMTLGGVYYNLGNLVAARRHLEVARKAWQPDPFSLRFDARTMFLGGGAMVLQQMGETAEADAWMNDLVEHAGGLEEPLTAASACRAISQYRLWAGDRAEALAWAERGVPFALEHGLPAVVAMANRQKGHAAGDVDLQRETIAFLQSIGYRLEMPLYHFGLAETLLEQERYDEARDELNRAIEAADVTGEMRHLAEVYRVLGVCARAQGSLPEAADHLEKAVAIARQQQSRFFEQRALADLSALRSA